MPKFTVELHDGRSFEVEADRQPTEAEVMAKIGGGSMRPDKDRISQFLDSLPMIGGAAGGMIGGVAGAAVPLANLTGMPEIAGATGGAALGGAAGESIRRLIEAFRGTGNGARPAVDTSLSTSLPAVARAGAEQAGAEMLGQGTSAGISKIAKTIAPQIYEMGLGRTPTMKADFPNAAQRGIDERIAVPTPTRVQRVLTKAEDQLTRKIASHDIQPTLVATTRKQLPAASELVPTGPIPTPQGGTPAVTRADLFNPSKDAVGPLANVAPERMFGPDRNYLSSPLGEAIADSVNGAGALRRPIEDTAPTALGAPPGMIDPRKIATGAFTQASKNADLTTRGIKAEPQAEMAGLRDFFLRDNPNSMTATDALQLKRAEQKLANYSNPNDINAGDKLAKQIPNAWHQAVAGESRQALEDTVPGSIGMLNREQDLLGLLEGAQRATNGGSQTRHMAAAAAGGMLGGLGKFTPGILSALAIEAQRSPYVMGPLGVGADMAGNAARSPWVRNLFAPNALRAAILGSTSRNSD